MCVSINGPLVTLTFDLLTLKLVCESYLRWGTFLPNLGSRIIRYVRDGRTDGRADKSNAYCPLPYGEHNKMLFSNHCLYHLLPPTRPLQRSLRNRGYDFSFQLHKQYTRFSFILCSDF